MATLKIYGKVVAVLPQQVGTSKSSGKQWFSQQFLVEEVSGRDGEYTNQVCFTLMNANLNEKNVQQVFVGNDVTVSFHVSSREWLDKDGNRRFSSDLQAYRVENGDTTAATPTKRDSGDFTPVFATATGAAGDSPRGNQGVQVGNAYYPDAQPTPAETQESDLPF